MKTKFAIEKLIRSTLFDFRKKVKGKNISVLLVDDLAAPLKVYGNPELLKNIFSLLMTSAAENLRAASVKIFIKQLLQTANSTLVEFTLIDDGTLEGINEKGRLFTYRKNIIKAKRIIESEGGRAETSSLPGSGNTFKFILKFAEQKENNIIRINFNSILNGKKILVVDDNEMNLKSISQILYNNGSIVTTVNNGKDVVMELEAGIIFDLILMDLQMPHMDGYQTANYIRKQLNNNVPIIGMSSSHYEMEEERCLTVGINEFLAKPIAMDDLLICIKNIASSKRKKPVIQLLSEIKEKIRV